MLTLRAVPCVSKVRKRGMEANELHMRGGRIKLEVKSNVSTLHKCNVEVNKNS